LLLTASLAPGQPPAPNYYPQNLIPGVRQVIQPTTPMPAQPVPMNGTGNGNGNGNGDEKKEEGNKEEETPPPTKYFVEKSLAETRLGNVLESNNIRIFGWTQMSYNGSTASGSNAPVFMIDRANEFLMNQNYLHVEKTLDTSKKELQFGWLTDWILPGSDARTTVVRGLWDDQLRKNNGGPVLYPIDPFQFYGQAFLPNIGQGTTVKLGRFATHCGYELVQAPDTPFVSRSYMFQYNPFTHTGLYANTQVNDNWSVGYGLATGTDTFIDEPTNRPTFIGQLKWAPKDGPTTAIFNAVVTNPNFIASENFQLYNFYNFVLTRKLNDKLSYVLDTGYSHMNRFPGSGFVNWYGAANYLIYAHTDTVTSTLRAEVFDDAQGARTGFEGLYTEVTYGVAWKPMDAVMIRPSVRYDNNSRTAAFEGSQNLFTAAMDLILRW
jgi:hypothetical protein